MYTLSVLRKVMLSLVTMSATMVFAAASVNIAITGSIPKFVAISTSATSASVDLASNYDQNTGALGQADHTLGQISALSNVRDGYVISATSVNNMKLQNSEGVEIVYNLRFDGASSTPSAGVLSTAYSNGDPLLTAGATTSFSDNTLSNANLVLQNDSTSDFVIEDENFADTVTLTITAN